MSGFHGEDATLTGVSEENYERIVAAFNRYASGPYIESRADLGALRPGGVLAAMEPGAGSECCLALGADGRQRAALAQRPPPAPGAVWCGAVRGRRVWRGATAPAAVLTAVRGAAASTAHIAAARAAAPLRQAA